LIEENGGEVCNDSLGRNIWWNLNILRDTLKGVDSLIGFFCLRPDYPELIEYRSKQSMPGENLKLS
jgi:hypothetical protein